MDEENIVRVEDEECVRLHGEMLLCSEKDDLLKRKLAEISKPILNELSENSSYRDYLKQRFFSRAELIYKKVSDWSMESDSCHFDHDSDGVFIKRGKKGKQLQTEVMDEEEFKRFLRRMIDE